MSLSTLKGRIKKLRLGDNDRSSTSMRSVDLSGHGSLQGYSTGGREYIVRGTQRPNLSKYASVKLDFCKPL